jgi:hypothetical protein
MGAAQMNSMDEMKETFIKESVRISNCVSSLIAVLDSIPWKAVVDALDRLQIATTPTSPSSSSRTRLQARAVSRTSKKNHKRRQHGSTRAMSPASSGEGDMSIDE